MAASCASRSRCARFLAMPAGTHERRRGSQFARCGAARQGDEAGASERTKCKLLVAGTSLALPREAQA